MHTFFTFHAGLSHKRNPYYLLLFWLLERILRSILLQCVNIYHISCKFSLLHAGLYLFHLFHIKLPIEIKIVGKPRRVNRSVWVYSATVYHEEGSNRNTYIWANMDDFLSVTVDWTESGNLWFLQRSCLKCNRFNIFLTIFQESPVISFSVRVSSQ